MPKIEKTDLVAIIAVIALIASIFAVVTPGREGPQGIQGEPGLQGVVGSQGVQGVPGVEGIQGIQGEAGLVGDTGPQGEKGDTGYGYATIASVYATSNSVARGKPFTLFGSGFDSGPNIQLVDSNGNWYDMGIVSIASFGVFSVTITIPGDASKGVGCLVAFQGGNPIDSFPIVIN